MGAGGAPGRRKNGEDRAFFAGEEEVRGALGEALGKGHGDDEGPDREAFALAAQRKGARAASHAWRSAYVILSSTLGFWWYFFLYFYSFEL